MENKYIYLVNNEVFWSYAEMPTPNTRAFYTVCFNEWKHHLVKLECSEVELTKIATKLPLFVKEITDITSITTVKDGKVSFKEVEVEGEVNEAIEFMNWVIKNEYFYNGKYWYKDFVKDKLTVEQLYEIFKRK